MTTRRTLVRCGLAALPWMATLSAAAADYPDHPIRMIVGFPAGQSTDASARRMAQKMADILKQAVYVDNKPGAAGIISHEAAKNAPSDGYTLLMGSTGTLAINPSYYRKLSYDPARDFVPVIAVSASPLMLFAPATSPVNNLKELIAYAKARPGKVTYGSAGSGTTGHIAMELLKKETGLELLHVPYKGSPPMMTDVLGGRIDLAFEPVGTILPLARSGRVKLLGVASSGRSLAAPEVPTLVEQGLAGFEAVPWTAIVVPKGTPASIVQRLNTVANAALKDRVIVDEFARQGSVVLGGSVADAQKFLQDENVRWGKAVKASGAQAD